MDSCWCRFDMVAASGSLPHCRSSTLLPFACCLVGAGTSTHNDFFELSFFSCVVSDVSFGLHRVPGCLQSWFLRFSLYSSCRCRCLLVHPVSRFGVGASSNLWMFPCFCWCRFGCSLLVFVGVGSMWSPPQVLSRVVDFPRSFPSLVAWSV